MFLSQAPGGVCFPGLTRQEHGSAHWGGHGRDANYPELGSFLTSSSVLPFLQSKLEYSGSAAIPKAEAAQEAFSAPPHHPSPFTGGL